MSSMAQFIPAILCQTVDELSELTKALSGQVNRIQIDFADLSLVHNRTVLPNELPDNLDESFQMEAHLMVDEPSQYFARLAELGFDRVIIHYEATETFSESLVVATAHNLKLGLAINPATPISNIIPLVGQIELLQIMSIQPGFGGQPFLEESYSRISQAKSLLPGLPLSVDGGVRLNNAPQLIAAGVDYLVVGKAGFIIDGSVAGGLAAWAEVLR